MAVIASMGSGEFKPWAHAVDAWCAERATAPSERALIVATASAPEGEDVFRGWGEMGVEHYRAMGLEPVVLPLRVRADASDPAVVDAVAGARIVFFSGGNPGYLCETIEDTPFWEAVVDAVASGTALGGCSAGAVSLGTLAPFVKDQALDRWVQGLRMLERAFFAPHFDMLDSYAPGLRELIVQSCPEGSIMVGLDEDTALCGDGEAWTVMGRQAVWVAPDGHPADLIAHRDGESLTLPLGLRLR